MSKVYSVAAYVFFLVLIFLSFIHSVFKERSVHSPFQSECSTDVELLLRITISRIISLSKRLSSSSLRLLLHPHPPPIFPSLCYESWTTVHSKTSSPQRLISFRISVSPIIPCTQFNPVAAYVFFFILIFLLSFRHCLTTVWSIVNSKETSLQRSM